MPNTNPPPAHANPAQFFLFLTSLEIGLGFLAVALGWLIGPDPRQYLPDWYSVAQIATAVGYGLIATLPLLAAALLIEQLPIRASRRLRMLTEKKLGAVLVRLTTPELICFGMVAGVGEELLFRGWLQTSLTGNFADEPLLSVSIIVGVIAASLLFGMLHALTPLYFWLATAAGIYLGGLYIFFSNLLVPITTHAAYDVVMLLLIVSQRRRNIAKKQAH